MNGDLSSLVGPQREYTEDALGIGLSLTVGDADIRFELFGRLDEKRGGAGMQAHFVVNDDGNFRHL